MHRRLIVALVLLGFVCLSGPGITHVLGHVSYNQPHCWMCVALASSMTGMPVVNLLAAPAQQVAFVRPAEVVAVSRIEFIDTAPRGPPAL